MTMPKPIPSQLPQETLQEALQKALRTNYLLEHIIAIQALLEEHQVFEFSCLDNGLFPASPAADAKNTGYKNVWIRDNIYVAYAHHVSGKTDIALKNVSTLLQYFKQHSSRFRRVIDTQAKPSSCMERPHVRFNGLELAELDEPWQHAQNDALGYFLWLYCKLHAKEDSRGSNKLDRDAIEVLTLFPLYFQAIQFWEDEDSGHWEEAPKIEASSIGVVTAGLKELRNLMANVSSPPQAWQYKGKIVNTRLLDDLIECGSFALNTILPSECIQAPPQSRRHDSALLFLAYPLEIIEDSLAQQIVEEIIANLGGELGIRRYMGDNFWCRDFQNLPKNIQNSPYTDRQEWLREHAKEIVLGEEAQWCIFDPVISAYYGRKYQSKSGKPEDLRLQTEYLNRSLNQITQKGHIVEERSPEGIDQSVEIPEFKCPELYYIQKGHHTPNTSTPLLWTQANLLIALEAMKQSLLQSPTSK